MRRPIPDRYAPENLDPALQTPGVLPTPRSGYVIVRGTFGGHVRELGTPGASPSRLARMRRPKLRDFKREAKTDRRHRPKLF